MNTATVFHWGDRLRKAREEGARLNASDFSKKVGISRTTVAKYERGEGVPKRVYIEAWAKATGVTVEDLLSPFEQDVLELRCSSGSSHFGLLEAA